ncbi:MAG: hypothetical protein K8H88_27450 [Sandaracinaceae bacterium]|nr:hypothetical protein [Sandaracinaceae bacterium]
MLDELRTALRRFHDTLAELAPARADALRRAGPASAPRLEALDLALGVPTPEPVREILAQHDGCLYQPLSPMRDHVLLSIDDILFRIERSESRRVVPLISTGLSAESGLEGFLGAHVDAPWGPLWASQDGEEAPSTLTIVDWLDLLVSDHVSCRPFRSFRLTYRDEWTRCSPPDLAALLAAPLGTAFRAVIAIGLSARRRSMLFVKLADSLWGAQMSLSPEITEAMAREACALLERETRRRQDLWAESAEEVAVRLAESREVEQGTIGVSVS